MPKPPLLVPPLPKEIIASQAWGTPVTNAVNGLVTGASLIGCIYFTTADTQPGDATFASVTLKGADVLYDSDQFFDDANNRLVIPPGLNGIYRLDYSVGTTTGVAQQQVRLAIIRNEATLYQVNQIVAFGSAVGLGFSGVVPMSDGGTVRATVQISGGNTVIAKKFVSLIRIADLPAGYVPTEDEPEFDLPAAA